LKRKRPVNILQACKNEQKTKGGPNETADQEGGNGNEWSARRDKNKMSRGTNYLHRRGAKEEGPLREGQLSTKGTPEVVRVENKLGSLISQKRIRHELNLWGEETRNAEFAKHVSRIPAGNIRNLQRASGTLENAQKSTPNYPTTQRREGGLYHHTERTKKG